MIDFEKLAKEKMKENKKYLELFKCVLEENGLTKKTIDRHLDNIDLYINVYLLHSDIIDMAEGMDKINYFFSYWGLEKLMWASKYSFTNMISSLKKFYKIMLDQDLVDKKSYEMMLLTIKIEKEQWLDDSNFID